MCQLRTGAELTGAELRTAELLGIVIRDTLLTKNERKELKYIAGCWDPYFLEKSQGLLRM